MVAIFCQYTELWGTLLQTCKQVPLPVGRSVSPNENDAAGENMVCVYLFLFKFYLTACTDKVVWLCCFLKDSMNGYTMPRFPSQLTNLDGLEPCAEPPLDVENQ